MQLTLHHHTLHLRQAFNIARSTRTQQRTTIVELSDGQKSGFGEVSDNEYYTQAHPDAVAKVLGSLGEVLAKADPDNPSKLYDTCVPLAGGNSFALSALDMAAHDLAARRANQPLYAYWGIAWDQDKVPISNYTLSINPAEEVLAQALANPWPSYKVKLGGTNDVATIELLRRELPAGTQLCVDANAGWTLDEAVDKIKRLQQLEVAFVEQPLARGAFAKTAELRHILNASKAPKSAATPEGAADPKSAATPKGAADPRAQLPLIADEDCQTLANVDACADAYTHINIKLSKCGGPTEALRMVARARELGLGVMFGCMIESSFAIGALRHFSPAADFIDLDGHLLVRDDVGRGIVFLDDGRPVRPTGMGSGVEWV